MTVHHILSAKQFSSEFADELFTRADHTKYLLGKGAYHTGYPPNHATRLRERVFMLIFWQESTRTRLTFKRAARFQGADVDEADDAARKLSVAKGESLAHTVRAITLWGYDALVMRHPDANALFEAARVSTIPVISAGAGGLLGEHPTQALADEYTLTREVGPIHEISIAVTGDLKGRAARSLIFRLARRGVKKLFLASPHNCAPDEDVRQDLYEHNTNFVDTDRLSRSMLHEIDAAYVMRIQEGNFPDRTNYETACTHAREHCYITYPVLKALPNRVRIMHPGPINAREGEITPYADNDKRSLYFRLWENYLPIRMALLVMLFDDTVQDLF